MTDKFKRKGLYKADPKIFPDYKSVESPYHCRNWTFIPVELKLKNGEMFMKDTYFGNTGFTITKENEDLFELIFYFDEVTPVEEYIVEDYDKEDYYKVAIDSGGYSYPKYFLKKDAKVSVKIKLQRLKEKMEKSLFNYEMDKREYEEYLEKNGADTDEEI